MINQVLKNASFRSFIFLGLTFMLMSAACENKKEPPKEEVELEQELFQLSGQFLIHQPHCGGRKPREDKIKQSPPYKDQQFVVKKGDRNQSDTTMVTSFRTDAEGRFSIQLPKGTYCILKATKNLSFTDFYNTQKQPYGQYYQAQEESCFKDWWEKCELTVVLEGDTILPEVQLYNRCFTGENPCMQYNGPLPP